MEKSYEQLIMKLKKPVSVPANLFNKVVFSIQKNKEKKLLLRNRYYFVLSPIPMSIVIFLLFFSFNFVNVNKQAEQFLLKMYDHSNYDGFFIEIDENYFF